MAEVTVSKNEYGPLAFLLSKMALLAIWLETFQSFIHVALHQGYTANIVSLFKPMLSLVLVQDQCSFPSLNTRHGCNYRYK